MEVISNHNWALTVGTFLPLVGVLIMLFIPKAEEALIKSVAIATAIATLAVGIYTMVQFDFGNAGAMQFVAEHDWISVIKSSYYIGIDGISLPLYLLSMVITVLVMIYSWDHVPSPGNPKAFFILMLILQTGMAGTFISRDLILFFVFFELVLLPMYFMIGVWGGENRQYASLKFFLYTMFGSALMLVAFLALFFKTGAESFSIPFLIEQGMNISRTTQIWIFAGMFVGFAVKVPMFPFHTWLPDAHTQAPTQGSVILAAVLLKLGTYGFVRIAIPVLPEAAKAWAPYIGGLAVIGIIYGSFGCLAQTDMKRLIAFSSVAHMGFVMLGIATLYLESLRISRLALHRTQAVTLAAGGSVSLAAPRLNLPNGTAAATGASTSVPSDTGVTGTDVVAGAVATGAACAGAASGGSCASSVCARQRSQVIRRARSSPPGHRPRSPQLR